MAPLEKFDLTDDELALWAETFHGGRTHADPRFLGTPFESVSLDMASCFPLVAHHIGWWEIICAETLVREDVTEEFRALCEQAVMEPPITIDPKVLRRFGVTLVAGVHPDGEILPAEVEDDLRPDGRLEFGPLHSPERPLNFTALSVLAASVSSGRVPSFEMATRYVPLGRQEGLRTKLSLLPGLTLRLDEDPVLRIVRHRRQVKARGEQILAGLLRVVVNALVFGNLCRFDNKKVKEGGEWRSVQVPGPYNFLPLASCVSAGAHLLLAVFERLVLDAGGVVAYMDTDSAVVPSSEEAGQLLHLAAPTVRCLTQPEISLIISRYELLSPSPEWKVWKVEDLGGAP